MTQVDLYETADGKLLIVNEPAGLAWRLGDYAFPGKTLTDLRRAAGGRSPRWAFGARPAPGVSGPELAELTRAARLHDGVYTGYLEAAGPAARSYLGVNEGTPETIPIRRESPPPFYGYCHRNHRPHAVE